MNKKLVKFLFLFICILFFSFLSFDALAESDGGITDSGEHCDEDDSPCIFYKPIKDRDDYQAFSGSADTLSWTRGNWRITSICFTTTIQACGTPGASNMTVGSWGKSSLSFTLPLSVYGYDGKAYNYVRYVIESTDRWYGSFYREGARIKVDSFEANPNTIGEGGSSTLSWSATHVRGGTINPPGSFAGSGETLNRSITVTPPATTTYTLNLFGPRGNDDGYYEPTYEETVTVNSPDSPWIDINAIPTSVGEGGITTLTWTGGNVTNCGAKSEPLGDWSGGLPVSGNESVGPLTGGPRDVEFIINCKDPNTGLRNITDSVIVGIGQAPSGGGGGGGFLDPFCERIIGRVAMTNPSWWWKNSNFSQTDWCESKYSCANPTEGDVGGFEYIIIDRCASGNGSCGDSGRLAYNTCNHPYGFWGSNRKNWGPIPFINNCDEGYFTEDKAYFDNPLSPDSEGSNVHSKFSTSLRPLRLYELQAWVVKKDCDECVKGGGWGCGANCGKLLRNVIGPSCSGVPAVNISTPASSETVSGTITISGWVLDFQTDLTDARFLVDGYQIIGSPPSALGYGLNRPDVCQTQYWDAGYPVYFNKADNFPPGCPPDPADPGDPPTTADPDNSTVGYSFTFDTRTIPNGSHILRVEFTDDDSIGGTGDADFVYEDQAGFAEVTINVDNPVGADMILLWDPANGGEGNLPNGWDCISCSPTDIFYQKYVIGSNIYGNFGGSNTHIHDVELTSVETSQTGGVDAIGGTYREDVAASDRTHSHYLGTSQTESASNLPRYKNLMLIRYDNGIPSSLPKNVIAMFDTEGTPSGFSKLNYSNNPYILGEGASGTGGSNTHTHTFSVNALGTGSGMVVDTNGSKAAGVNHNHVVSSTTSSGTSEPKHADIVLGKVQNNNTPIPFNMLAMFGGQPNPDSWEILSGPGGVLENDFLKAAQTPDFDIESQNTHTYENLTKTSGSSTAFVYIQFNWGEGLASDIHTHSTTVSFDQADHTPLFRGVIIAKKTGGQTPTVSNVTINNNFCSTSLGTNISWIYSDPDNDLQDHYQVQIDDNSNFNSPEYDSCLVIPDTCQSGFSTPSHSTPSNILEFDETYYARVKVWDTAGQFSDFQEATICTGEGCKSCPGSSCRWETPIHAYPYIDFTYTPSQPSINQKIQFNDSTVFYGGATGLTWNWDFGDNTFATGSSVSHTYTTENTYTVTETVADTDNFTCDESKTLDIRKPIPFYKEIAPK